MTYRTIMSRCDDKVKVRTATFNGFLGNITTNEVYNLEHVVSYYVKVGTIPHPTNGTLYISAWVYLIMQSGTVIRKKLNKPMELYVDNSRLKDLSKRGEHYGLAVLNKYGVVLGG
jgi:desulfoferrodoxin (superoxide reductase-like protein)